MLQLIAQSSPDMSNWMAVIGSFSGIGFAVWYSWYRTTVADPKREKEFSELIMRMEDRQSEVINRILNEFREETKEQRVADRDRAKVSNELARSGHAVVFEVTKAIDSLKVAIQSHGISTGSDIIRGRDPPGKTS